MSDGAGSLVDGGDAGLLFSRRVDTFEAAIYIAGDPVAARRHCRAWVDRHPRCVTVEPVHFVYTGGEEEGVRVKLIHYPRFPATRESLWQAARELGFYLLTALEQESFSIVGSDATEWYSRRPADLEGKT